MRQPAHTHRCRNLALAASTSYSTVCRLSSTWDSSSRGARPELLACRERQLPGCRHTHQQHERRQAAGGRQWRPAAATAVSAGWVCIASHRRPCPGLAAAWKRCGAAALAVGRVLLPRKPTSLQMNVWCWNERWRVSRRGQRPSPSSAVGQLAALPPPSIRWRMPHPPVHTLGASQLA